ncbi:MAG: carbonic anhydrase family protein, partial [Pseudomonadota bacterium]|nr:carbonic anhydrase family protein [Pseudomonadota bacterium]
MLALTIPLAHADDKAAHAAHWSYDGKTAPTHWADLDHANSACKLSKEQSPINIEDKAAKRAPLAPLGFHYQAGSAEVINNGHTVQVNLPPGSTLSTSDGAANLLQFHFHTPSEEKVNGTNYPMVAHFVHKSADGKLSVVAVLFKEGKENPTLAPLFAALPAEGKPHQLASFDPAAVLPAGHAYYKFTGSLTTPPCSDGVRWQVLKQPVELSKGQIAAFRKVYPMNARPVQPLNGRV